MTITTSKIDVAAEQRWLAAHKADTGLSWAKLSARIGIPQSTISMFPGGTYAGKNEPLAEAVAKYRGRLEDQATIAAEMPEPPSYFETPTGRRIRTMLTIAQRGRIVVIAGGPGTSKTENIRNFRANGSNVWVATMAPSTAGVNTMQQTVLDAMGEPAAKGTPLALSTRIKKMVGESGGLIIIDEAQHTSEKALEEIRSWHDATGVGIALVGNEDVLHRLTLSSRADAFARLASRVGQRYIFRGPSEEDALALATAWNVEADDQRAFLAFVAKQPGGLRTCTMVMETAWMLASGEGTGLSLGHLEDAWKQLSTRQLA